MHTIIFIFCSISLSYKKKRDMIIFISFFLVAIFSTNTLFSNEIPEKNVNHAQSGKSTIIVGGEINYPPYSFLDKNGGKLNKKNIFMIFY